MEIKKPVNESYAAVVSKVSKIVPIEGMDRIQLAIVNGFSTIVGKDTNEGDFVVFFPPETQLSHEFAQSNNLYRKSDLNEDKEKKGYFDENRRVRAVKFKGNQSNCFVMKFGEVTLPLNDGDTLVEGDTFDELNGIPICKKYEVLSSNGRVKGAAFTENIKSRVWTRLFPEHKDTLQMWKFKDWINKNAPVYVTQKLHGCLIRVGNVKVERKLSLVERIAKKLGAKVTESEYAMLYGSRHVIKDANNPNQKHFYGEDVWTENGKKLDGLIPKDHVVYGELIGYTKSGKAIQENYTYNLPFGQAEIYVYRVTTVNEDGVETDMAWEAVKEFCQSIGVKYVPQLGCVMGERADDSFLSWFDDCRYHDNGLGGVQLSSEDTVDEGIVLRQEAGRNSTQPLFLKQKSKLFYEHESTQADKGTVDMETSEVSA